MIKGQNLRKNLFLLILSGILICLIFSKYVMSMGLLGLLCLILFTKETEHNLYFGFNKAIFDKNRYLKTWPFAGFILYFLWIFISIIWSSTNIAAWGQDVTGKLSILGIAFIFLHIPRLNTAEIRLIHHSFFGAVLLSCLLILAVYIPQFDEITFLIRSGRPIPTPIDHVRFSMMVSYASLSAFAFALLIPIVSEKARLFKKLYVFLGVLFFIFCHMLAVRSGLMLLYLGVGISILYYIIINRAYFIGLIGIILLTLLPIVAYHAVPSFKSKVLYTKYDIEQSLSNKGANYSDGDRLRSIQNGMKLWKENVLLGHGAGDYRLRMQAFYNENDQSGRHLLPHNQWVRSGMAYGLFGVLFLLSGFILALFRKKAFHNILLLLILQIFFFSLLVESNIERYYALVFFLIFIGLNAQISFDKMRRANP